jgi:glycosyltransferase involved in cell wall biosynthesis
MSRASAPPRLTVLLPCYNAERDLPRCLDSLLAQSYRGFEILAIDDGSTDGTPRILAEYARQDRRLRVLGNGRNLGLPATLNRGLDEAKAAYIARQDADDEAEPARFEAQIAFLDADPSVDVVSSSAKLIDTGGRVIGERRARVTRPSACRYITAFATPLAHGATLARRECLVHFRYSLEPAALHVEDYELWGRLVRSGRRLANIPDPLYRIRVSPQSVSVRNEGMQVQNFVTCAQGHLREGFGEQPTRETVAVLTNRVDFQRTDITLSAGLTLLGRLTERALHYASIDSGDRCEILDAAAMQRLDIVLQSALKGRGGLRARALARLPAVILAAIRRPRSALYVREKARVLAARIGDA